jgi:hypothetical protein
MSGIRRAFLVMSWEGDAVFYDGAVINLAAAGLATRLI